MPSLAEEAAGRCCRTQVGERRVPLFVRAQPFKMRRREGKSRRGGDACCGAAVLPAPLRFDLYLLRSSAHARYMSLPPILLGVPVWRFNSARVQIPTRIVARSRCGARRALRGARERRRIFQLPRRRRASRACESF